jgi:hypothetical protein
MKVQGEEGLTFKHNHDHHVIDMSMPTFHNKFNSKNKFNNKNLNNKFNSKNLNNKLSNKNLNNKKQGKKLT